MPATGILNSTHCWMIIVFFTAKKQAWKKQRREQQEASPLHIMYAAIPISQIISYSLLPSKAGGSVGIPSRMAIMVFYAGLMMHGLPILSETHAMVPGLQAIAISYILAATAAS